MNRRYLVLARFDRKLRAECSLTLVGVDEAGRGCLAGPVVAASVVLAEDANFRGLDDSKRLNPEERQIQAEAVRARALAYAWCFVGPRMIDAVNIRQASLLAMRRAVARVQARLLRRGLSPGPCLVLVDGEDTIPGVDLPQRSLIEGDGTSLAVAAASVIAKTVRDGFMTR